ncbi:NUDIX hydrolase [Candidatus Woesearchaeota archaeon]|nr:NUDIX hydrolase [Candidatus Woesearchaeota archaeon]
MKTKGPWRVDVSKVIYRNPWLMLEEDEVEHSGVKSVFGYVTLKDGAHVLPIDEEGNVYLLEEFRYGIGKEVIEVAGGAIEKGETPLAAATRELAEELGIKAGRMVELGIIYPLPTYALYKVHLYLALDLTFCAPQPEIVETFKIVKMPFHKAVEMVDSGEIPNSQAIVVLLKAQRWMEKNRKN